MTARAQANRRATCRWVTRGITLLAMTCLTAGAAQAQGAAAQSEPGTGQQADRPYRGIFGAGSPAERGGHALDLQVGVSSEYGRGLVTEDFVATSRQGTGWFTGVRAALSLEKNWEFTSFGLRSEGSLRYYPDIRRTAPVRNRTEAGLVARLGRYRRTALRMGATAEVAPYFQVRLFDVSAPVMGGEAILPIARDDDLFSRRRTILSQSVGLDYTISPRSSVTIEEETRQTATDLPLQDVSEIRVGARFNRQMTQFLALRLGYANRTARSELFPAGRLVIHDIEASFDYRRPLGRSRRTSFALGAGTLLVDTQPASQWRVSGFANLRRELGRGWFVQLDAVRDVQVVEGFSAPLLANTITASAGGFAGRRVELLASGGYSAGEIGFAGNSYRVFQGSTRLRLALSRFLALDGEALVYDHRFARNSVALAQFPDQLDRWTVRLNLTWWLPLSR